MTGWAVEVRCPPDLMDTVGSWLVSQTGAGVEERTDGALASFAPDPESLAALERNLMAQFGDRCIVTAHPQEPVDWRTRWREGLGPRQVGRITILPSWDTSRPAPGTIPLVIDPEMAFGSGEHGSTRGALFLADRAVQPGSTMLDVGSGSGIVAITAALLGARRAIGIECDAEAIPVATQNAVRNKVGDRVSFLHGDAAILTPLLGPADLIVSNILRSVNTTLVAPLRAALSAKGVLIFAGMETDERSLFLPVLHQAGLQVHDETVDEGWWAVAACP